MNAFDTDIDHCLKVLEEGGIILYPTDTIWGIGCDATNEAAVNKIFRIKQRGAEKSLIVLLPAEKDILKYVASPDPAVFDYLKNVTRPTTVIYDGAIGLAPNVVAQDGTVAIRVVRENFCRHLLKRFRKPVVSTSANFSGDPAPRSYMEIVNDIRTSVDYIVAYRQEEETVFPASTLVKWNKDGSQTVLRP